MLHMLCGNQLSGNRIRGTNPKVLDIGLFKVGAIGKAGNLAASKTVPLKRFPLYCHMLLLDFESAMLAATPT